MIDRQLPELTRGKEIVGPLLDILNTNVEPGRDDSALVQPSGLKNINTVKLGYNELGYNELPLIANKFNSLVGF